MFSPLRPRSEVDALHHLHRRHVGRRQRGLSLVGRFHSLGHGLMHGALGVGYDTDAAAGKKRKNGEADQGGPAHTMSSRLQFTESSDALPITSTRLPW